MANQISIVIQAQDNASKKIRQLGNEVKSAGDASEEAGKKVFKLNGHIGALAGVAASAGVATYGLLNFMSRSVDEANKLDSALLGLTSIARAYSEDVNLAKKASQELASDGLMSVADSATGLKNLLAAGFSLPQAITLMKRFKDSAAFGRQGSLSFGQAVASATEGIKNGNSILVDNAGVTKNLSVMLKEAGLSASDLGNASSDAAVRQAIFNGILKETNAQTGDAARLADSAAGKQERWNAQTQIMQQRIGTALQPALLALLTTVTPIVEKVAGWIEQNPQLAAGILITVTALTALVGILATVGLAVAGFGPVFALFQAAATAAIGGVSLAFTGLKALILSPIAMPAIAVAAAIASLVAVQEAANRARSAVEHAAQIKQDAHDEDMRMIGVVKEKYQKGEITKEQYSKMLGIIGRNASGTNNWGGGWSLVGEHGPEMVRLPQGSSITPSYRTREHGPVSSGVTIQSLTYVINNEMDEKRALRDLGFALELAS